MRGLEKVNQARSNELFGVMYQRRHPTTFDKDSAGLTSYCPTCARTTTLIARILRAPSFTSITSYCVVASSSYREEAPCNERRYIQVSEITMYRL